MPNNDELPENPGRRGAIKAILAGTAGLAAGVGGTKLVEETEFGPGGRPGVAFGSDEAGMKALAAQLSAEESKKALGLVIERVGADWKAVEGALKDTIQARGTGAAKSQ